MVHTILPDPEPSAVKSLAAKARQSLAKTFSSGLWGITLHYSRREVFIGIAVNKVIVPPVRRELKVPFKPSKKSAVTVVPIS